MTNMMLGRLFVATAALALGACGGGGGGSGFDSTPMPTPTPSPTPTPTPTFSSPPIFAGITVNTDFAELGLYASDRGTPASALTRDGFSVRYDAATQSYFMDLPVTGDGRFVYASGSENASYWDGFINGEDPYVSVFKPTSTNPLIQLTYTSFGVATGYYTRPFGFFAFGIPTPSSGIPVTGTASYEAYARGRTLNDFSFIEGDVTLQFDFGAGTLAGHFDPTHELNGVITDLGTYNFINTVFGVGSTTFSGSLSHSSIGTLGAFDGRFTGPAAQELMARWTAPYLLPGAQQPGEMFGVWVGKKQ